MGRVLGAGLLLRLSRCSITFGISRLPVSGLRVRGFGAHMWEP